MSDIDPEVGKVLKACGLGADAAWKHKQSGKYIVYHWALERAAAAKNIKFEQPTIVHADPAGKFAVIVVTGSLGEQTEWSFGEAAPYNTQQTYPFSMAEKRGKDRVILKLIGLHGLAYSEDEADDFKKGEAPQENVAEVWAHGAVKDIERLSSIKALQKYWTDNQANIKAVSPDILAELEQAKDNKKQQLTNPIGA